VRAKIKNSLTKSVNASGCPVRMLPLKLSIERPAFFFSVGMQVCITIINNQRITVIILLRRFSQMIYPQAVYYSKKKSPNRSDPLSTACIPTEQYSSESARSNNATPNQPDPLSAGCIPKKILRISQILHLLYSTKLLQICQILYLLYCSADNNTPSNQPDPLSAVFRRQ